jgi:hypothetical protein
MSPFDARPTARRLIAALRETIDYIEPGIALAEQRILVS